MTFYEWLRQEPNDFLLRMYDSMRIPKNTNKLCKLLRYVDSRNFSVYSTREALKKAHRAWRAYRRKLENSSFVKIDVNALEIPEFIKGLKPLGEITISGQWVSNEPSAFHNSLHQCGQIIPRDYKQYPEPKPRIVLASAPQLTIDELADFTDEQWNLAMELGAFPDKPERWERVYRRWGFKHRNKCPVCGQPNKDYLTCLHVACVHTHMKLTGYCPTRFSKHEQD